MQSSDEPAGGDEAEEVVEGTEEEQNSATGIAAGGNVGGGSGEEKPEPPKPARKPSGPVVVSRGYSELPLTQLRSQWKMEDYYRRHRVLEPMHRNKDGSVVPEMVADVRTHVSEHHKKQGDEPAAVSEPEDVTEEDKEEHPDIQVEPVLTRKQRREKALKEGHPAYVPDAVEPEVADEQAVRDSLHAQMHGNSVVVARTNLEGEDVISGDLVPSPLGGFVMTPQPVLLQTQLRGARAARRTLLNAPEAAGAGAESATEAAAAAAGQPEEDMRVDPSEPVAQPNWYPNPRDYGAADESDMQPWMNDDTDLPPLPEVPQ